MKILHGFNIFLYALNGGVWYFGAHHTGMAILSLGGVALGIMLWKLEAMTEVREHPVIGTHYIRFSIWKDDVLVHKQLSPYSEKEIRERVHAHRRPTVTPGVKPDNWATTAKRGPKPKAYDWRTGPEE